MRSSLESIVLLVTLVLALKVVPIPNSSVVARPTLGRQIGKNGNLAPPYYKKFVSKPRE